MVIFSDKFIFYSDFFVKKNYYKTVIEATLRRDNVISFAPFDLLN